MVLAAEDAECLLADTAIVAVLVRQPFHDGLIGVHGEELHVVAILRVIVSGACE